MISGSTLRLYVALVLFPQVLWLVVSRNLGLSVLCDNCSLLPQHLLQHHSKRSSPDCHHQESGADNLTERLCSCSVDSGSRADREGEGGEQDVMKVDPLGGW